MNKFIFGALGLLIVASFMTTAETTTSSAKVFHRYTATDNGDSCLDPKETLDLVVQDGTRELLYDFDAEKTKMFRGTVAALNGLNEADLKDFDRIQVYDYPDKEGTDLIHFYLFNKGCLVIDFDDTMDNLSFIVSMTPGLVPSIRSPIDGKPGFNPEDKTTQKIWFPLINDGWFK